MSLTVTDLAEEVRETNRRLTAAIDALRTETEDLRVEVARINTSMSWMKGIGAVVAGSAFAIVVLVGTGIYRFGHVEGAITRLERDVGQLRGDMDQLKRDGAELRSESKAREDRLSRILERIEKALPSPPRGSL